MCALIRFYQRHLSPLRGPCCLFVPSCSQYALRAIERHGALRGGVLAFCRLLRCRPFARPKNYYDPVP